MSVPSYPSFSCNLRGEDKRKRDVTFRIPEVENPKCGPEGASYLGNSALSAEP